MGRSCILIKEVPKHQTRLLNLFQMFIDNQFLHSPDNCLIDECNANLSSKEKLSTLRKRNIDKIIVAHLNISSWKILTEKKHRQIKLKDLQKARI